MHKIVLVTSGQPALNPRLVKEADALTHAGYAVTVIYSYWNNWGDDFTKKLLAQKRWKAINAGGHPREKPFIYLFSRLLHKLGKRCFINWGAFAEIAISRSARFLTREAKKHKADIYIGHNLGALPAIVKAAKKYKAKCGFDAEDFHRNEVNDNQNSYNYTIAKCIEDKYFNRLDYLTTSSPQIADAYKHLYPVTNPITILNVFPKFHNLKARVVNNGPIKLCWFSQTIGTNRGIKSVIDAINALAGNDFELHLLGYITEENKKAFNSLYLKPGSIYFHEPIHPDEVFDFCSQFDIGLASEPGFSINNKLALSNKLFTYLQAGSAILASDTAAQKFFIGKYSSVGKLYHTNDTDTLIDVLSAWQTDRQSLYEACESSLKLGREELNWENESAKFIELINTTLGKKIE